MPQPNNSFIVVECQTAPNNNKKRVCVPKSWVQCELREKKVAIAYPAEDETRIATRIKNNEPADSTWSHYIGEIKYEAESYVDAVVGFVTNEEKMKKIEKEKCEPVTEPQDSLKLRIVLPKHKLKSEKKKSLKKHLKEHTKHKIHKHKQKKLEKKSLKENMIRNLESVTKKETSSDSGVSDIAKELFTPCDPKPNCQNSTESSQKSLETKIEDMIISSLQDSLNQQNNNNQSTDSSKTTLSECLDFEQDKDIDLSNSNLTTEDRRKLLTLEISQRQTLGYIKAVLMHIKTLYLKVVENKKTLNSIVSKYKDQPPASVPVEEIQQNVQELEQEGSQSDDMETLRFDDEMEDDNEDQPDIAEQNESTVADMKQDSLLQEVDTEMANDSDFETFIDDEESTLDSLPSLPPSSPEIGKPKKNGIAKTNSTWTLKHPHPGKGLVHLGSPKDRVYVNAKGLEEAKRVSINVKMFARLLCKEVFTPEALKMCSMTGKKATGNGSQNTKFIRPSLHSHARTVIINYAMSYGKEVGWEDSNMKLSTLLQSLRCMLQRCRNERIRKRSGKIRFYD